MSQWPMIELGDLISFRGGGTPSKDKPEYWSDDISWATVKDFKSLYLDKTQDSISEEGLKASSSNLIPAGHVIIPTRMALGKAAINTIDLAINQDLRALLPQKPLNTKYLLHAMLGLSDQIESNGSGATVKGITQEKLKKLRVPYPPLKEQKRIAKILDVADALRAKRRESLAQLDALLQSAFLDFFGDPFLNSKGWATKKLGEVCEIGSSKRVFVDDLVESGIPFYRGMEVGKLADCEDISPSLFISEDHYFRLKGESGVPNIGDLLLPSICSDGRIYQIKDSRPFYFKDARVLWIKCGSSPVESSFIRYFLKLLFLANYSKIASGTTFAELKIFALKKVDLHIPPDKLQERFARVVSSIERKREKLVTHLSLLDSLFLSTQARAFSGEL